MWKRRPGLEFGNVHTASQMARFLLKDFINLLFSFYFKVVPFYLKSSIRTSFWTWRGLLIGKRARRVTEKVPKIPPANNPQKLGRNILNTSRRRHKNGLLVSGYFVYSSVPLQLFCILFLHFKLISKERFPGKRTSNSRKRLLKNELKAMVLMDGKTRRNRQVRRERVANASDFSASVIKCHTNSMKRKSCH